MEVALKNLEDLDEGGASKEEAKHVGHDVVTDHAGDGNDEPGETRAVRIAALKHRDVKCARRQTCARSPDHPLKQVMDDEVRLGHHDQQSHMGPTKLEKETETLFNTFKRRKSLFISVFGRILQATDHVELEAVMFLHQAQDKHAET